MARAGQTSSKVCATFKHKQWVTEPSNSVLLNSLVLPCFLLDQIQDSLKPNGGGHAERSVLFFPHRRRFLVKDCLGKTPRQDLFWPLMWVAIYCTGKCYSVSEESFWWAVYPVFLQTPWSIFEMIRQAKRKETKETRKRRNAPTNVEFNN